MSAIQREDPAGYTAEIIQRLALATRRGRAEAGIIAEATKRKEKAEEEHRIAFRELHEELKRMDVVQSGNYGWEFRTAQFLTELHERIVNR